MAAAAAHHGRQPDARRAGRQRADGAELRRPHSQGWDARVGITGSVSRAALRGGGRRGARDSGPRAVAGAARCTRAYFDRLRLTTINAERAKTAENILYKTLRALRSLRWMVWPTSSRSPAIFPRDTSATGPISCRSTSAASAA